jgi:hypothetical protein
MNCKCDICGRKYISTGKGCPDCQTNSKPAPAPGLETSEITDDRLRFELRCAVKEAGAKNL